MPPPLDNQPSPDQQPSFYQRVLSLLDQRVFRFLYSARVRRTVLQSLPFWIASLLTGMAAVAYERVFVWAEETSFAWLREQPLLAFVLTPLAFLLAWALVRQFAPAARGSGIPQVMAAIELSTPVHYRKTGWLLSMRVAIVKVLSSVVLLLGGGVIGREGPTIQVSAAIFRAINRLQPVGWPQLSRQVALITGGAAGLAAAFNTPLGGIVFVVEELTQTHLTQFRTAVFTAVIIAGLTAQGLLGPYLYLGYPNVVMSGGMVWLGVGTVAVVCGLAGALFAKSLLWISRYRNQFRTLTAQAGWVLGCGLLMGGLAYGLGSDAVGTGKPIINRLLFQSAYHTPWYLAAVRWAGMALSYSSGAAGGIFATSLSVGSIMGDGIARLIRIPTTDHNLIVLVSMVSFLTGVVRSPFTAAILVLEMTDRHSVIFQLLLGGLLAQGAASLVDPESFYEHLKAGFMSESMARQPVAKPIPTTDSQASN